MRGADRGDRGLAIEAVAFGLGYASLLCWASVALVAAFGGARLASPYWPDLPWLRTDTTGVIAFALAAISFIVSRYLRLRGDRGHGPPQPRADWPAAVLLLQAVADTAAVLAAAAFAYLSLNVVTHSVTLRLQLTHLWPWPSEGTVRVIALGICLVSAATGRYLRSAGPAVADRARAGGRVGTAA